MDNKELQIAYLAGYMQKEADSKLGSVGDLAGRLWDRTFSLPKIVSDGPKLSVDQLLRVAPLASTLVSPGWAVAGIGMNKVRDAVGDIADWNKDRKYANSTLGKIDQWTADNPGLTYGVGGGTVAAATAYAVYRMMKKNKEEKAEEDFEGLI